ncbi:hypothetical protein SAMN05216215_103362 [Saccharopolyspora shandongensis]|uniref:Uncharacterized protein n=1 Tax=Saccharopolyspora shandongensis TaxID=418495 RepID=A0A1H3M6L9_9PSEU|nr:hypothetical protein [Saccharopolyspora shandongensis]SDY71849.1 hypothetical protein SAMN05216215_103362 [Saccharopolyspora shandongensis]
MQIQALNNRAKDKYQELHNALEAVRIILEEAKKLHEKITEPPREEVGWQVPDKDDVEGAHYKAVEQLNTLHASTVKWEKQLVANGWRV